MNQARIRVFVAFAILMATICVRLGVWQLSRREQRHERNVLVASRLDSGEVPVAALPRDTALARFRRSIVVGTPDFDHELLVAARTYKGSPGVHIVTPVRIAGNDTAVLVNRGWVYSPDASTVDLARWREPDTVFRGYVEILPPVGGKGYAGRPRIVGRLTADAVAAALPYPVRASYLVVTGDSTIAPDRIARLTVPPLDGGPHLSYAIQWFAFATVALVGAGIVVAKSRVPPASS